MELEQEIADGLQLYFDKALGQMLLYSQEREQYEQVCSAATHDVALQQQRTGTQSCASCIFRRSFKCTHPAASLCQDVCDTELVCLGGCLQTKDGSTPPSSIYGGEHLLRLLVKVRFLLVTCSPPKRILPFPLVEHL